MRTVLVIFGGQARGSALSASIDVIAARDAVRSLPDALDGGWRIAALDVGAIPDMLRVLTEGRSDAPEVVALEDAGAVRDFVLDEPVDAVVVLGGNEATLALVDEIDTTDFPGAIIPVASTGGAAAAIHARDPDGYGRDLERAFAHFTPVFKARLAPVASAPGPRMG